MKIRSLAYHIKDGFKNIHRNKMFSLASIATITACIFLFGVFYSIVVNFQYMIKKAETEVCVTALKASILQHILNLQKDLKMIIL